ncbi:MAG: hypothetical protein RLZZ585_176 [Bacteroidota bacterium]|jgi:hypothetical protein
MVELSISKITKKNSNKLKYVLNTFIVLLHHLFHYPQFTPYIPKLLIFRACETLELFNVLLLNLP